MSNQNQVRVKILSRVTVDAALTLKFYCSSAAQYDTAVTCDLPAGDYYLSDDHQSDDLIYILANAALAASIAAGFSMGPFFWIDEDHKVNIQFIGGDFVFGGGDNDVKIAWTEEDGAAIGAILGFDTVADLAKTTEDHPTFTGEYQHAYAWYAPDDGMLVGEGVEDSPSSIASQSRSIAGQVKTLHKGDHYDNHFDLTHMTEAKTFSGGVGYGEAAVYPYERNAGLECWFHTAKIGTPFRVYRHHRKDTSLANARGVATGGSTTVLTDSARDWEINPERWAGAILALAPSYYVSYYGGLYSFYLESNTDNDLTISNMHPINHAIAAGDVYYLFDIRYKTYVLKKQGEGFQFNPTEIARINRFMYKLMVSRYVA